MLKPLKNIPLNLVIESLSGNKIIPFNQEDKRDMKVLSTLIEVAKLAGKNVNKEGIKRPRPNEVGNDIEPFVMEALRHFGYRADKPETKGGKIKAAGYPDIEIIDEFNRINYIECKTYNIENISTTQRSFYLSPSEDFKITKDGHHFVLSFEIYEERTIGSMHLYKCKKWKIISVDKLLVDVKYEFNSDNRRLYSKNLILAEGSIT